MLVWHEKIVCCNVLALLGNCWLFAGSDLSSVHSVSPSSPKNHIVDFDVPEADIALVTIPGTQKKKRKKQKNRTQNETRSTKKLFRAKNILELISRC